MSEFKPKVHSPFKAVQSTAKAATLKPRKADAESAFFFGKVKETSGSQQILL